MSSRIYSKDQGNRLIAELIAREVAVSPPESLLWVADEHHIPPQSLALLGRNPVRFISNRFDQYTRAKQAGLNAGFSDFSLTTNRRPVQQIFFRVAKERPLTHHVINQAFSALPVGGVFWLAGHKNEGIKTYIAKASGLFGGRAKITKSKNQLSLAAMTKVMAQGEPLNDNEYPDLRQLPFGENHRLWTKPGIYGWDKIDQGSLLLGQSLAKKFRDSNDMGKMSVLDLGCGYGYLSSSVAKLNPGNLVATDNCVAALRATAKNLEHFGPSKVLASDAGAPILESFDLILCNPPFHQGFVVNNRLHKKFLTNTKRLLKPKGQAWYVVNQFLPVEKHCDATALSCREMTRNSRFKIVLIRHKRPLHINSA